MKVFALILVVIAMADAKGSGPYLYGRPEGPAFMLPSEVAKPKPPTTTVDLNQGSEASGSDFLQEYGPPQVLDQSLNLISQGLPDVTIEQAFGSSAQSAGSLNEVSEAKPEIATDSPTTAQSSLNDNPPISAELPILDFVVTETTPSVELATNVPTDQQTSVIQTEVSGQSNQITSQVSSNLQSQQTSESVSQSNQESTLVEESSSDSENAPSNTEVLSVNAVASSEQKLPEGQNIPNIIASLEKEVTQEAVEFATVSSLGPVPEGFLEYGPPGFVEYGPPKGDEEKSENLQTIESNETRRRRFSPKSKIIEELSYSMPKLRLGRN